MLRHLIGALFLVILAHVGMALAAGDPPGRVGRLSAVEGEVTFRVDRQDGGTSAAVNWPVAGGAIIDTGRRSRAELWIGSTAYRLDEYGRMEFVAVNDQNVELLLAEGALAITIRDRDQADDLQILTPRGRIRFPAPGRYRIEVRGAQTTMAAQAGTAELVGGYPPVVVNAGEMAVISENGPLEMVAAPYGDDFDNWVSARDRRNQAQYSRQYVSPHMTGAQDLDAYGDWQNSNDYGAVWYPRSVAADWAPYRYGRWAWVEPWGWTWVDDAPWGFAPFHYGRWVNYGGRWGWAPGAYVARPVYAPALVGWVGNPGWSVNFSYGAAPAVGWFPLGPREVYVPGYRATPRYVRQVNVGHVHDPRHIDHALGPNYVPRYVNRDRADAVTVVPANTLRDGRPIDRRTIRPYEPGRQSELPATPRAPDKHWIAPGPDARQPTPAGVPPKRQTIRTPTERYQAPVVDRDPPGPRGEPGNDRRPDVPAAPTNAPRDTAPDRRNNGAGFDPRPNPESRGGSNVVPRDEITRQPPPRPDSRQAIDRQDPRIAVEPPRPESRGGTNVPRGDDTMRQAPPRPEPRQPTIERTEPRMAAPEPTRQAPSERQQPNYERQPSRSMSDMPRSGGHEPAPRSYERAPREMPQPRQPAPVQAAPAPRPQPMPAREMPPPQRHQAPPAEHRQAPRGGDDRRGGH